MRSFAFNITPAESALNQVFLNPLVRGPQVIALILPAARGEDLRFSHRLVVFTKAVCEGGFCQCLLCRGWQQQRLHGIPFLLHPVKNPQHLIRAFNHLTHHVPLVWHPHLAKRLTADEPVLTNRTK